MMSEKPGLVIASDHAGVELKAQLKAEAERLGYRVEDLGPDSIESVDYPDYAQTLTCHILEHPGSLGVLICGSGIGMSIAANRIPGIRAALCHDGLSAELSRRHNNANVLCLGARLTGVDVTKEALQRFLRTEFEAGRHVKRVEKLG